MVKLPYSSFEFNNISEKSSDNDSGTLLKYFFNVSINLASLISPPFSNCASDMSIWTFSFRVASSVSFLALFACVNIPL